MIPTQITQYTVKVNGKLIGTVKNFFVDGFFLADPKASCAPFRPIVDDDFCRSIETVHRFWDLYS